MRCTALLRLHPCANNASDVDDSENVIPTAMPINRSRVNRVGRRKRLHIFVKISVQAMTCALMADA